MDDSDFLLLDLEDEYSKLQMEQPHKIDGGETFKNKIFEHFTNCFKMFEELLKIYLSMRDEYGNIKQRLEEVKQSAVIKFRLECEREPELNGVDLSHWVKQLEKAINELRNGYLNSGNTKGQFRSSYRKPIRRSSTSQRRSYVVSQVIATLFNCTPFESSVGTYNLYDAADNGTSLKSTHAVQMLKLLLQLHNFEQNGIPKLNFPLSSFQINCNIDENLELISIASYKEFFGKTYKHHLHRAAIMELVESEIGYLKSVKLIIDLFLAGIRHLQSIDVLNEIQVDNIFSNITEIHNANVRLWSDCFLVMIRKPFETRSNVESPNNKNDSELLLIDQICEPYIKYCLDQTKCLNYYRSLCEDNECFSTYLTWSEMRKDCNRLKLKDFLAVPFQRIMKYPLLLKAVLKYTDDAEQKKYLKQMIKGIEEFIKKINVSMKNQENADKMKTISERLEPYQSKQSGEIELESIVSLHRKLDLYRPMPDCGGLQRCLLYDSNLKIKSPSTSLTDAHYYLFTDMLLICKSARSSSTRLQIIQQPYMVDRIIMQELKNNPKGMGFVYLDEFGGVAAAVTLYFDDQKALKNMLDNIQKAQQLYHEAKMAVKNETIAGLRKDLSDESGSSKVNRFPKTAGKTYGRQANRTCKRYMTSDDIGIIQEETTSKTDGEPGLVKRMSLNYGCSSHYCT